jgi:prolyl 4-hydroxylase
MKISTENKHEQSEMHVEDQFLSNSECAALIRYLKKHGSKRVFKDPIETHTYATASRHANKVIADINKRASKYLGIAESHMENMVLIDYELEEVYKYHNDFEPNKSIEASPIVAQVLMFLTQVESGGGTDFPNLGLQVSAKKGRAVFWYGVKGLSRPEKGKAKIPKKLEANRYAVHSPIPVQKGKKIIAILGFHQHPYAPVKDIILYANKKEYKVPADEIATLRAMIMSDVDLDKKAFTRNDKQSKPVIDRITLRHHLKKTPDLTLKIVGQRGNALIYEDSRFQLALRMDTTNGELLRMCLRCIP